jgi:hypothetical protein
MRDAGGLISVRLREHDRGFDGERATLLEGDDRGVPAQTRLVL